MYQVIQTDDHYSVKSNSYNQVMLIYKTLALLLYFWGVTGTSTALKGSTVVHLFFGLLLMTLLYMKLPFYRFQVLKLVIILTTVKLCLSLASVIYVLSKDLEVTGGMHILIVLLPPLAVKAVLSQFRNLFKRILQGDFNRLTDHAIHFGVLINDFIVREKNNLSEDQSFLPNRESYYGALAAKGNIEFEKFGERKTISECETQIYLHVVSSLHLVLDQNPDAKVLALYKVHLYLTRGDNIPRVFEILRRLEMSNKLSNLAIKSSMVYINNLVQKMYEDDISAQSRLGLADYFKYYDMTNAIKASMLTETNRQIEFWEDVQKRDLDAKEMYDRAGEIDALFVKIRRECELNLNSFRKNFRSP
ncbi:MAG: hypothetical protein EOP48_23880, partial [Sphingobacteriales bacterium]